MKERGRALTFKVKSAGSVQVIGCGCEELVREDIVVVTMTRAELAGLIKVVLAGLIELGLLEMLEFGLALPLETELAGWTSSKTAGPPEVLIEVAKLRIDVTKMDVTDWEELRPGVGIEEPVMPSASELGTRVVVADAVRLSPTELSLDEYLLKVGYKVGNEYIEVSAKLRVRDSERASAMGRATCADPAADAMAELAGSVTNPSAHIFELETSATATGVVAVGAELIMVGWGPVDELVNSRDEDSAPTRPGEEVGNDSNPECAAPLNVSVGKATHFEQTLDGER
jgi:hypothetical protein